MRIDGVVQRLEGEPVKLDKSSHDRRRGRPRGVGRGLRRAALPNRLKRRRSFPTVAWCAIWLMKRPKKPTAEIDSGLHDGMAGRPFLFACPCVSRAWPFDGRAAATRLQF